VQFCGRVLFLSPTSAENIHWTSSVLSSTKIFLPVMLDHGIGFGFGHEALALKFVALWLGIGVTLIDN